MKVDYWLGMVVVVAIGWGAWSFFTSSDEETSETSEGVVYRAGIKDEAHPRKGADDSRRGRRGKSGDTQRVRTQDGKMEIGERLVSDDADEAELSKLQKAILKELKAALDANNLKGVRKAIARFKLPKKDGGLGGDVPKVMRSHAVSALGWFGSGALSDLTEFMSDIDPEIEEESFAKFEQALDDWDVSDRERAAALKSLLKVLHDTDRIDSMLMALNNMRNSVKGEAIIAILGSGTEEARTLMQEQLELYTDFDVTDAGAVGQWIKDNPDSEWDEEFYGPQK